MAKHVIISLTITNDKVANIEKSLMLVIKYNYYILNDNQSIKYLSIKASLTDITTTTKTKKDPTILKVQQLKSELLLN